MTEEEFNDFVRDLLASAPSQLHAHQVITVICAITTAYTENKNTALGFLFEAAESVNNCFDEATADRPANPHIH